MSDLGTMPALKGAPPQPSLPPLDPDTPGSQPSRPLDTRGRSGRQIIGLLVVLLLLSGALGLGVWCHYQEQTQVAAFARQQADFVPEVRVQKVTQRLGRLHVTLPGTTLAFEQANIYARASGYVAQRFVDIGDHVKAGQVLADIRAPEIEDQISQYQNGLQQAQATQRQTEAQRQLAQVTSRRSTVLSNEGWATQEQGDTDRYNFQAEQHATRAAQFSASSMQAQLKYFDQQKDYQQVVAPFDGVITQRNIDVGSLIIADATSGTSMFFAGPE
jgi:multidrug efflux pump subunit AcrA (membrane-fusion protein)